jgi:putative ABC transport system permease protein
MDFRDSSEPPVDSIDAEVEFHFAEVIDALMAQGWSEDAARAEAERRFGDRVRYGHELERISRRSRRRKSSMRDAMSSAIRALRPGLLIQDCRYALRTLARSPGFTLTVVLTLALGIGANGAVFSAVNSVLLEPLPFPDADRLVRLNEVHERSAESNIAPVRLEDWHRLNNTFEAISGYYTEDVSETGGDFPERVRRATVAPRFVEVWGVHPALGRGFTPAEHLETGSPAVLISDRFWRTRFGGNAGVLSRTVRVGTAVYPIVGVMPASFRFPDRTVDLWFPIALDSKHAQSRRNTWYTGIGRLKSGVTIQEARANLAAVQAQLAQEYPDPDRTIGVQVFSLKDVVLGDAGRSLWLLFGSVSLVLLIVCTNIASLLVSRGARRRQELAVRLALGASSARIAVQLLIESLLMSLAGAAVGLAIAGAAVEGLRTIAADFPRIDEMTLDVAVVSYTVAIAFVVAALCGVLPALRAKRDGGRALAEGARTQVSSRHSLQWLLVGAQVAMSVVLLAGAGLLVRSLQQLRGIDAGFDAERVLTFRVSGDYSETGNPERLRARVEGTIDALRPLPGVQGVAASHVLPGVPIESQQTFTLIEAKTDAARRLGAERRIVSPEYFETMKIPLIEGEACRRPGRDGPRLVMINQAFRSRYLRDWPSPVGLHLAASANLDQAARIVGVTKDARDTAIDRDPVPTVYSCMRTPNPTLYFLVRTDGDPLALAQAVRVTLREREPLRSVYDVAPLDSRIGGAFAQNRLRTNVLSAFAIAALALAGLGLYGTLSFTVNLRRREVGLRLALGAMRTTIVRQILTQGLIVIASGCVVGLALALSATRLLQGMLFGVSPTDPIVMTAVVAIVMAVAVAGSLIPAVRASAIEPMRVLRDE